MQFICKYNDFSTIFKCIFYCVLKNLTSIQAVLQFNPTTQIRTNAVYNVRYFNPTKKSENIYGCNLFMVQSGSILFQLKPAPANQLLICHKLSSIVCKYFLQNVKNKVLK